MNCQRCGATIDPAVHDCPYCGLQTPAGAMAAQMAEMARLQNAQLQAQRDAYATDQQRRVAAATVESSASTAMWMSLAALVLCCSPLGVVGAAFGFRARSAAAKAGVPAPGRAMIAIVVGLVGAIATACFLTFAFISSSQDQAAAEKRAAEIDKKLASKIGAATIDHDTACQMGESYLLHNGWDDRSGYLYHDVECVGKFTGNGDAAELEDMTFKYTSDTTKVSVCLKHGVKWYVDRFAVGSCAATAASADAGPSGETTATPSASTAPSSPAKATTKTPSVKH